MPASFIMTTSRKRHCYSPLAFYSLHLHINGHHSTFYKCNKLKQRFSEIAQTEIEDNKKNQHKPLLLSFQSNKNTPAKPNSTHNDRYEKSARVPVSVSTRAQIILSTSKDNESLKISIRRDN